MNDENRELIEGVLTKNLNAALDAESGSDEEKVVFKQAMEATAQLITLSKNDDSYQEHSEKLALDKEKLQVEREKNEIAKEHNEIEKAKLINDEKYRAKEEEFRKKEARNNWIYRVGEVLLVALVAPLIINKASNRDKVDFAEKCMDWEVNGGNTFTTTPGRSSKDFFKLK